MCFLRVCVCVCTTYANVRFDVCSVCVHSCGPLERPCCAVCGSVLFAFHIFYKVCTLGHSHAESTANNILLFVACVCMFGYTL